jgi:hypothetical protein
MKKKPTKMTPEERAAWDARADENLRTLRRLIDRGWDELEASGEAAGLGGRPRNAEENTQLLRRLIRRARSELEARRRGDAPASS